MSSYEATVHWQRAGNELEGGKFSRAHSWQFDGGLTVPASPAPGVVPPPLSDPAAVDPEEAFVASLSSCHMLFFLAFAEKRGFPVADYCDEAVGILEKTEQGRQAITRVTLRPQIDYVDAQPTPEQARALHDEAHKHCYIANSVSSKVEIES